MPVFPSIVHTPTHYRGTTTTVPWTALRKAKQSKPKQSRAKQTQRKAEQRTAQQSFFLYIYFLGPPGEPGKKSSSSYTFVCAPVFVHLQNADLVLTWPLRLSQRRGLAGLLRPNPMRVGQEIYSRAKQSKAQHSTAQHSTAQHSTAQHSTAQHSTAEQSRANLQKQSRANHSNPNQKVQHINPKQSNAKQAQAQAQPKQTKPNASKAEAQPQPTLESREMLVVPLLMALAIPKSMSFKHPLTNTKFAGLRSLCTTCTRRQQGIGGEDINDSFFIKASHQQHRVAVNSSTLPVCAP